MLYLSGKLKDRSESKPVSGTHGEFIIINFSIEKTHKSQKKIITFTARGKLAEKINNFDLNVKMRIYFYPNCSLYNNRWFTELVAENVDIYKKEPRVIWNNTSKNNYQKKQKDLELF